MIVASNSGTFHRPHRWRAAQLFYRWPWPAIAFLLTACVPVATPHQSELPWSYFDLEVSPHQAYSGPSLSRDEIAVVLVQTRIRVQAINGQSVPVEKGYAIPPGAHSFDMFVRPKSRRFAATITLTASPGGFYGVRFVGKSEYRLRIEDLKTGYLIFLSDVLERADD